jgi:hypothetical protein
MIEEMLGDAQHVAAAKANSPAKAAVRKKISSKHPKKTG